jgi:hypothetical protein
MGQQQCQAGPAFAAAWVREPRSFMTAAAHPWAREIRQNSRATHCPGSSWAIWRGAGEAPRTRCTASAGPSNGCTCNPRPPVTLAGMAVAGTPHPLRPSGPAAALLAGIALAACTRVSDDQPFPPVRDRLAIARTIPEPGGTIPLGGQIDFCFDGFVDPRALDDFAATVTSGRVTFDAQLDLQLFAWRPPGAATGTSNTAWCDGSVLSVSPRVELKPGSLHRIRLQPEAVGWGGESLDVTTPGWVADQGGPTFQLEFTVTPADDEDEDTTAGTDTGGDDGEEHDVPAPSLGELFAPGQVFNDSNPACGCHREAGLARERLDLRSPEAAFADLVLPAGARSTGFPMISPGRPSESYLIQTLLRDPDGSAIHGVLGDPMPPDEPLAHADMTALALWIEGGALL